MTVAGRSANTIINTGGGTGPNSDARAYGRFENGITAPGTLLPLANQNLAQDATFAGGIDIDRGVCLSTGLLDDDPTLLAQGRGTGITGPNNGINPGAPGLNEGEISTVLNTPSDVDFEQHAVSEPGSGDATVLQFKVQFESPGFLRISFVFGSDEHPFHTSGLSGNVNDSVAIIIENQHYGPENIATTTKQGVKSPFNLFDIAECDLILFLENDVAPSPQELEGSLHGSPGAPFYDIEFGGFTKKLTRETSCVLAPGLYNVKIVIQDVADRLVDSTVFIEENSLTLYPFLLADFDLDGDIDWDDFLIWQENEGKTNARFTDGDANGDGVVDVHDLDILYDNFGQTGGNKNFCADFNRDGVVDGTDLAIWEEFGLLSQCASRFEGDANGDGDVDGSDFMILQQEMTQGVPSQVCQCAGVQESISGGFYASGPYLEEPEWEEADLDELAEYFEGEDSDYILEEGELAEFWAEIKEAPVYHPADFNQDGVLDQTDLDLWRAYYHGEIGPPPGH